MKPYASDLLKTAEALIEPLHLPSPEVAEDEAQSLAEKLAMAAQERLEELREEFG